VLQLPAVEHVWANCKQHLFVSGVGEWSHEQGMPGKEQFSIKSDMLQL
jgi:hypothetical protein